MTNFWTKWHSKVCYIIVELTGSQKDDGFFRFVLFIAYHSNIANACVNIHVCVCERVCAWVSACACVCTCELCIICFIRCIRVFQASCHILVTLVFAAVRGGIYVYMYIHTHTHTHGHRHTHTHTQTHIHIHTHTYTHTHIHVYIILFLSLLTHVLRCISQEVKPTRHKQPCTSDEARQRDCVTLPACQGCCCSHPE